MNLKLFPALPRWFVDSRHSRELTQNELSMIHTAIVARVRGQGLTDEVDRCMKWCIEARMNAGLLETLIAGVSVMDWPEGAVCPRFGFRKAGIE